MVDTVPKKTPNISVIIPVRENETEHHELVSFFENIQDDDLEIIITKGNSRAHAMNKGVEKALGDFLWFVHADTKIKLEHIKKLKISLHDSPERIHYFDLKFDGEAGALMPLNSWGANIRSRLLGFPWGDQGLCIKKKNLAKIGYYDESLLLGEDHALILRSRMIGIKLNRIAEPIMTSSRLYSKEGWLKLTLRRQIIWPILTIKMYLRYRQELQRR